MLQPNAAVCLRVTEEGNLHDLLLPECITEILELLYIDSTKNSAIH